MTFYVEIEDNRDLGLDYEEILTKVATKALDLEECPYEATINLTITDDISIQEINKEFRDIDNSTDVLSFPMNNFNIPGDFSDLEEDVEAVFDPDSGELVLGDIVISLDHVLDQAQKYGHSILREISFLIAHSVLHLIGYDHMTKEEEVIMFEKQEIILNSLGINRGK